MIRKAPAVVCKLNKRERRVTDVGNKLMVTGGRGEINLEVVINIYILLYIKYQ